MGTIRFNLRTDKKLISGKSPVELVYQVKGQRKYYNTGLKLYSDCWNATDQKALYLDRRNAKSLMPDTDYDLLPTSREAMELNSSLQELKSVIEGIEKRFEMDKVIYSSEMVIDKLKEEKGQITKKEAHKNALFDFMDYYIEIHKTTREKGSLSVYKALKNHLANYESLTKKRVTFTNIDYYFFQSFQNFLIDKEGLNNTTVAKQLSTVKTFLNYAKAQGIEVSTKYKDFKIKKENLEVIALTNDEFEKLYYFDFSKSKKLSQVRDVFCFACVTGLRYSDLAQLKREHIKKHEIKLVVKKTKDHLSIPLTPYSKSILSRYEGMLKPLPVISNQKLNDYVKEMCELAGIDEEIEIVRFRGIEREAITYKKYQLIGVHTGRKTFATLSLERGMNAEEVMTITGHKDYKSFKRYVKVTEERKKVVMMQAWGAMPILKVV